MPIYVEVAVSHPISRVRLDVGAVQLSDRSMHSWLPSDVLESLGIRREGQCELQRPDGTVFSRQVRYAVIEIAGRSTIEDVIACEAGDVPMIGWRTLTGLNLRLDENTGRLVDRGPIPAAPATMRGSDGRSSERGERSAA